MLSASAPVWYQHCWAAQEALPQPAPRVPARYCTRRSVRFHLRGLLWVTYADPSFNLTWKILWFIILTTKGKNWVFIFSVFGKVIILPCIPCMLLQSSCLRIKHTSYKWLMSWRESMDLCKHKVFFLFSLITYLACTPQHFKSELLWY